MKGSVRVLTVVLTAVLLSGIFVAVMGSGRAAVGSQETPSAESLPPEEGPVLPFETAPALTPGPTPEPTPEPTPPNFTDVDPDAPTGQAISYAAQAGLLLGVGDDRFDPDSEVTRAMAVTVLYRMSGETFDAAQTFPDVSPEDWFAPAAAWGVNTGVVNGYEDGTFRGGLSVTRAQLAALFYRFICGTSDDAVSERYRITTSRYAILFSAAGMEVDRTVLEFYRDNARVPDYAKDAMAWAVEHHLFAGMTYDSLYPDLPVTRAQLAQMLTALCAAGGEDAEAQAVVDSLRATVVTLTPEAHDLIQSAVETAAQKYGAIGMQVAVIHNGRVIDAFATGWATKNTDPMTVDHKLREASLSKVDVAMAAMVLWDEGVIDLDESIGTYWGATMRNPYYKNTPVTIRSILSHTSSLSIPGDSGSLTYSNVRAALTGSGYSYLVPGSTSSYSYNNNAFGALGMTLELAAGKNLNQVMEPIFSMLDIDVSYFSGDIKDPSLHATIYQHDGSVGRSVTTARGNVHPSAPGLSGAFFAGGFTASAQDQARLVALLAMDGKLEGVSLISEEAVELMESPLGNMGGYYQCHPLRRQDDIYGRDTLYYHTGSAFGVYNLISYDPDTGDGVVVLTSGASAAQDSRGIYAVCGTVSNTIYDLLKDGDSYVPVEK